MSQHTCRKDFQGHLPSVVNSFEAKGVSENKPPLAELTARKRRRRSVPVERKVRPLLLL
jgi:hypothetical protein